MNLAEGVGAVRPKLRQDTIFIGIPDGVFVRTDETSFVLKGAAIYQWVSKLSVHLDGSHTVAELCDGLPEAQQRTISSIVSMLLQRGLAKDARPEDPTVLSPDLAERYRTQIEFIDHHADEPLRRFAGYRDAKVLLVGTGEARDAFVAASVRNGLARIHVPERERGGVVALGTGCSVEGFDLDAALSELDLVVYCGDDIRPAPVAALARRARREGVAFLPVTVIGRRALLGPLSGPDDRPCWHCAMLRLTRDVDESVLSLWRDVVADVGIGPSLGDAGPIGSRMLGTATAVEAFARLTGYRTPSTAHAVVIQNLDTLESWRVPVTAHPLCPVCRVDSPEDMAESLRQLADQNAAELGPDDMYESCVSFIDPHVGVFTGVSDAALEQVPLKAARLNLGWPASGPDGAASITAYGVDSLQDARYNVLLSAASRYAQSVIEPNRLLSASVESLREGGHRHVPPDSLVGCSGLVESPPEAVISWVAGVTVEDRQRCLVPAAAVYPYSALNRSGIFDRSDAGNAAASSYRGLVAAGLRSAAGAALLHRAIRGQLAVQRVDPAVLLADSQLGFLAKNAQHASADADVLLVEDGPFVLAIAVANGVSAPTDLVGSWGVGIGAHEAIHAALLDLLGRLQALRTEGRLPDLGRVLLPDISVEALQMSAHTVRTEPVNPDASVDLPSAFSMLEERGYRAVIVETTPSDLRAASQLRTARVCLATGFPSEVSVGPQVTKA